MKLLENKSLEDVELFVRSHAHDFELDFRLESYSCKMVSTDRREWRRNVRNSVAGNELQPLSPPEESFMTQWSNTPFGNFNSSGRLRHSSEVSHSGGSDNDVDDGYSVVVGTVSRKTLFNLTSVLNLSYNDYDFSQTKSERFFLANIKECMQNIEGKFSVTMPGFFNVKDQFWKVINDEIKIDESVLYSYMADFSDDPYSDCLWSFNYFFYNRNLKRILFLSCRTLRLRSEVDVSSDQMWD